MFKNHQKCLIFIFPQFLDFWQKVLLSKLKKTSIYEIIIGLKNVELNVRDLQGRTLFRFSNSVKIEKCENREVWKRWFFSFFKVFWVKISCSPWWTSNDLFSRDLLPYVCLEAIRPFECMFVRCYILLRDVISPILYGLD